MGAFSRGMLAGSDGQQLLVLARGGGRLEFRDPATGELMRTSTVNGQWVYGMATLHGNHSRVAVGFSTGEIAIINLLDSEELDCAAPLSWPGDRDEIIDLLVTRGPDPLIVAAGGSGGHLCWLHASDLREPPNRRWESGVRALCLADGPGDELMVFVDREGDVWSLPVNQLNDTRDWEPTLICKTGNQEITAIAAIRESGGLKTLTGGVDRRLEIRDNRRVLRQMYLDSWVNDIVVGGGLVTVITNLGISCYYGLL